MEAKFKHLELIQGIIDRLASNLFFLKGWSITLVAALFALGAKDSNQIFMLLAYMPTLVFWILDGYFLSQERLFRALYNDVRKLDPNRIDFSMDTSKYEDVPENTWVGAFCSKTLVLFYVPIAIFMAAILYANSHK